MHRGLACRHVDILDDQQQLSGFRRRRAPGQVRRLVVSTDQFAGVEKWDRAPFLEVLACDAERFGSLKVRSVPSEMGFAGSAVLQQCA
jgi:hypothetical protein